MSKTELTSIFVRATLHRLLLFSLMGSILYVCLCFTSCVAVLGMDISSTSAPIDADSYDLESFIEVARTHTQREVGFVGNVYVISVTANFQCYGADDCQFRSATIWTGTRSKFNLPFVDPVFATTQYALSVSDRLMNAQTFQSDQLRIEYTDWEDRVFDLEQIMAIAFDAKGNVFAQQHERFTLGIDWVGGNPWRIYFGAEPPDLGDVALEIDPYDGCATTRWDYP